MSKTVAIEELQANLPALLKEAQQAHDTVLLTDAQGEILAEIFPIDQIRGPMYGTIKFEGDIISPLDEEWDCEK